MTDLCVFSMNVYQNEGVDSDTVLGEFKIYILLFPSFFFIYFNSHIETFYTALLVCFYFFSNITK